jgi:hypothetical protein
MWSDEGASVSLPRKPRSLTVFSKSCIGHLPREDNAA